MAGVNKVGRPTALTEEVVQKLESIFKIGGNVEEALSYGGIAKSTYFDHLKKNDDFRTKMESAQHYANVVAKNVVIDAIVKQKDLQTAKWWLEKKHPDFKPQPSVLIQNNFTEHAQKELEEFT